MYVYVCINTQIYYTYSELCSAMDQKREGHFVDFVLLPPWDILGTVFYFITDVNHTFCRRVYLLPTAQKYKPRGQLQGERRGMPKLQCICVRFSLYFSIFPNFSTMSVHTQTHTCLQTARLVRDYQFLAHKYIEHLINRNSYTLAKEINDTLRK